MLSHSCSISTAKPRGRPGRPTSRTRLHPPRGRTPARTPRHLEPTEMMARTILSTYAAQGQHFAALVTPYSLRLLYLMILVEILTLGITWMMGSEDPPEFAWR